MELERGELGTSTTAAPPGTTALLPAGTPHPGTGTLPPEESTLQLRRCTALATRARVELLGAHRHPAEDELEVVLGVISAWDVEDVRDPDPAMTVLAAAALQDLAERLPADHHELGARIALALPILRALLERTHPTVRA